MSASQAIPSTSRRIGARARERRRFYRASVVVSGRMLDALGREHECRTADLSPGDMRVATPIALEVGQRVIIYLEGFGRISGRVARQCGEMEFAIIFDQSSHKREKLAEALTLFMNRSLGIHDTIRPDANVGARHAQIELEEGGAIEGEVLDFSLAGITIRTPTPAPPLGAWVRVGGAYGKVARKIDGGFAVDFEPRGARG